MLRVYTGKARVITIMKHRKDIHKLLVSVQCAVEEIAYR